jgi:hypothetical protein
MTTGGHVLEHGSSRSGRWLRAKRIRITLWIAAFEGLLYLVHVLHWYEVAALALIGTLVWWFGGRGHHNDIFRQGTWIFAASQLLVICVPLAFAMISAFAIGLVALIAIAGLVFLFIERG